MAKLYVVCGTNGSGKTTFAKKFLPKYGDCQEFINADLIAAGLAPLRPQIANFSAGRIVIKRLNELARSKANFAFETTLSGASYARLLRRIKSQGYEIIFFYLWLPHSKLALKRIKERVSMGGHDVPKETVIRRFQRSLDNLYKIYWNLTDKILIFDNSSLEPKPIAFKSADGLQIFNETLYHLINRKELL